MSIAVTLCAQTEGERRGKLGVESGLTEANGWKRAATPSAAIAPDRMCNS